MPDPNIPDDVKDRLNETLSSNGAIDKIGDNPFTDTIADPDLTEFMLINGSTADTGRELWSFDGVSLSLVEDIFPGFFSGTTPNSSSPGGFTLHNGAIYFGAKDEDGTELWRLNSDGTVEQITDINTGTTAQGGSLPNGLTSFNGLLYFGAHETFPGAELWSFDGTSATKVLATTSAGDVPLMWPGGFAEADGKLFFQADDGVTGAELWMIDDTGTPSLVKDLDPNGSSSPTFLTALGEDLFFSADDGSGRKLWKYEGENDGLSPVNIRASGGASSPENMTVIDGNLYFKATDDNGSGTINVVFQVDDATETLTRVADVSAAAGFTGVNGKVYFSGVDVSSSSSGEGRELWEYDPATGTTNSYDINPGAGSSNPLNLTAVGDTLYFTADDGTNGRELWRLNADGTTDSFDFVAGPESSNARVMGEVNGYLVIQAEIDRDDNGLPDALPSMLVADGVPSSVGDFTVVDDESGTTTAEFNPDDRGFSWEVFDTGVFTI